MMMADQMPLVVDPYPMTMSSDTGINGAAVTAP